MPSYVDYNELKANAITQFKENYSGVEGLNGIIYKSKINGKEIFIPNISFKQSDYDRYKVTVWDGTDFGCWTSTNSVDNEKAYMFYCSKTILYAEHVAYMCGNSMVKKWYGAQIRPIKKRG